MKRIAIISLNGSSGGGIESVVKWQIQVLQAAGCHVKLISAPAVMSWGKVGLLAQKLTAILFPWLSPAFARAWAGSSGAVFSHGWSSIGLGSDVVFAHGCWHVISEMWGVRQSLYSRFVCLCEGMAARLGKRVICVSDRVRSDWIKHYKTPPSRMEVMHNTCDTAVFTSSRHEDAPAQNRKCRILFVGRLEKWKGMEFLARFWSEVQHSGKCDIDLTICTPTPTDESISAAFSGAEILASVEPTALSRLYSSADLLLLPSMYESFEMVTIEALCCGTPVMLNDTGTRPFLEQSQCPGLFRLRPHVSPLKQVNEARAAFKCVSRDELATWARSTFDPEVSRRRLLELAGVQ
jgi:glycosyltransferase involved in cell wall biosynthesis